MITKKLNKILVLAAAMLAAGCSPGDDSGAPVGEAVRFTASIAAVATPETPATRTTDGGDSWVQDDPVGIFMLTQGGDPATSSEVLAGNALYKASTGGALTPDGTPIYYAQDGTVVDFVAYYPHDGTASTGTLDLTVAGQTTEAAQNALDVLYARKGGVSRSSTPVTLSFDHVLSKVTLDIQLGTGLTAFGGDDITAVTLGEMPLNATLNLHDGALTAVVPGDFTALKTAPSNGTVKATFTALLIPQEENEYVGRTATITVDGVDYVGTIPDGDDFEAGEHYTYPVTVSLTGVTVSDPGIAPWEGTGDLDNTAGSGGAEFPKNGRITWKNGRYALTIDPTDAGLYFKFGSVVGIFSSGNGGNQLLPGSSGDEFDAGDMAWSPVDVTDNWNLVPYSPGVNIDDAYHTVANVKAGTGDPCRLVGLDLTAIKTANESTLTADDIDNGIWRLPTNDENVAFIDLYKSFSGWQTLGGVNGHQFPNEDTFLPAAGSRTTSGTVSVQGSYGSYWTSAKYSYWHYLFFSSTTVTSPQASNYTAGRSVRCVRQ